MNNAEATANIKAGKFLSGLWLALASLSTFTTAIDGKSWQERPVSNFATLAGYALVTRKLMRNFFHQREAASNPASNDALKYYRLESERHWSVAGLFGTHLVRNLTAVPEVQVGFAVLNGTIAAGMTAISYHAKHKADALEGPKSAANGPA